MNESANNRVDAYFMQAYKSEMEFLTTEQVAERLGVGPRRVQAMVKSGRLPASRFGRALMIKESDLALVADRKPGRPSKPLDGEREGQSLTENAGDQEPTESKRHASKKTAKKGARAK
jgi:excisionase family DNA binding protein